MASKYFSSSGRIWLASAAVVALTGLAAQSATAQTMNANSASYNAGYGRFSGQENRAVDPSTVDASGNRLVVNGIIQVGADSFASGVASASASGVGSASGSSSSSSATAIGNNLNVVTTGDYNTVIVSSIQTNKGAVTATTTGGVGNGH